MTRYHNIGDKHIAFTAEEEAARDEEEKAWDAAASARAFKKLRKMRNAKIAESDYKGNSDVTMSSAWKTYRKALRDLPGTLNDTTVLETITWPTEPS